MSTNLIVASIRVHFRGRDYKFILHIGRWAAWRAK